MEVAVLIATYNGASYIGELLNSLKQQDFQNFTCYVHDDGSTDGTIDIVRKYRDEGELDINILDYPPTGSAKANFMSMLKYIHEPYAMFCDQDDVWLNNKIEISLRTIKSIECGSLPVLTFSDLRVVDENLNTISDSFMKYTGLSPKRIKPNELLLENVVAGCTAIMNRYLYEEAQNIQTYEKINIHDHFFALLASCSGKIAYINQPLILYRQHGNNEKGAIHSQGTVQRALDNYNRIKSGVYKERFSEWICRLQEQASFISKMDCIDEPSRILCKEFSEISKKNKLSRIWFYIHNQVLKKEHKMWFLLWC